MSTEPMLERLLHQASTRRQLMRQLGVGGLALSTPALLSACGSSSSTSSSGTGDPNAQLDHLEWLMGPTTGFDYAKDYACMLSAAIVTEPVVVLDDKLQPVGHLAESWDAVDPTTYVYKVRQGVKFTDGTPLTAEDVAFSMDRHRDPKLASLLSGYLTSVESIEATSDTEVTVKLKKPDASWRYFPAYMLVGPKKHIEQLGKDYGAPGHDIIGTGPFKVTKFKPSATIDYVANPDYWGDKPVAKTLTLQTNITDAQTSLLAMRAGAADGTFGVSATILRDWKQIPDIDLTVVPSPALLLASFDVEAEPWNDEHLRKAFAYALDRDGLLNALLQGNGDITNSVIPRALWGGAVSDSKLDEIYNGLPVYDYDLDKAKAELAKSKYPDGLEATIWYYASDTMEKIALTWAQALKQIGVKLKLEVASDTVGTEREDGHKDLGFHLIDNWTPDYPDPINYASVFLWSKSARPGYYNEANYKNPDVDAAIVKNLASIDQNERADLMVEIMNAAQNDLPYIPIWTRQQAVAVKKSLVYSGFVSPPDPTFWVDRISPAA